MPHRRPITEIIPEHLLPYIARQDASLYTPIDHASWRYILRVSKQFFAENAHQKYVDGLKETGISTERIPLVEEMDQCLKRFGWRAVPVSGFIPPAIFMEFQSLGILPIACEMRTLEHLAYTPAPDIVHEAAGHAPILADLEYANYLRNYGEVSRKAILSDKDLAVYEAIRELSDLKENPKSTEAEIAACQKRLDERVNAMEYVSEATLLSRMNWWTVEYGLVGPMSSPKIYGAGLLSSVGESFTCLSESVKKIPFSLDCINTSYDITKPQPQLFVTPDFAELSRVLEEFAATMAFRTGGLAALEKAERAASVTTCELDTGVQVSGVLVSHLKDERGLPSFLRFSGPVQVSHLDRQMENQGPSRHPDGFSSPIGTLAAFAGKSAADLSAAELAALGFSEERAGRLVFASGIELEGILRQQIRRGDRNLVLTFDSCTVRSGNQTLFEPAWGVYDLVCGASVKSVFGGAADRSSYLEALGKVEQLPKPPKTNLTEKNRELNQLYASVRSIRETGQMTPVVAGELDEVQKKLGEKYPDDWLLRLELLELNQLHKMNASWEASLCQRLDEIARTDSETARMIRRGLELL